MLVTETLQLDCITEIHLYINNTVGPHNNVKLLYIFRLS